MTYNVSSGTLSLYITTVHRVRHRSIEKCNALTDIIRLNYKYFLKDILFSTKSNDLICDLFIGQTSSP